MLATEREVNNAVEMHLKERVSLLQSQYKNQESKKDSEVARIETERNEIKERKTRANEEIQSIVEMIKVDTEERKKREEEQDNEDANKDQKIKEKMSMEDAARYI